MSFISFVISLSFTVFSVSITCLGKPYYTDKSFSEDSLHCANSNEDEDNSARSNIASFSDYYKPQQRFDVAERLPNNEKRSVFDDLATRKQPLQKRQVGVIYRDAKPIGILQPFQRSYRFIPVKEEPGYSLEMNPLQDSLQTQGLEKRDVSGTNQRAGYLGDNYPSILANFRIDSKLDKKRSDVGLTDENVHDLKETIRRLRSSGPQNNEKVEQELKNILDDMGLIEDNDTGGEKREIKVEDQKDDDDDSDLVSDNGVKDRNKRDDACSSTKIVAVSAAPSAGKNFLTLEEKKNEIGEDLADKRQAGGNTLEQIDDDIPDITRSKREKDESKEDAEVAVKPAEKPVDSGSQKTARDSGPPAEGNNDEKRAEREIQGKINSLKEEVKREIEALKNRQEEETQRKKRHVETLIEEESDAVNPVMHPDSELKPLVPDAGGVRRRKRRQNKPLANEESEGIGELLDGDFYEGAPNKRQSNEGSEVGYRDKRSEGNYDYLNSNLEDSEDKERFRRRIEEQEGKNLDRPQQLSDMSDLDLFGALPEGFEGELSRYKRVKRSS